MDNISQSYKDDNINESSEMEEKTNINTCRVSEL